MVLPPLPTPPPSPDTPLQTPEGRSPSQGTSLGIPCSSSRPWALPCSAAVTWLFSRSFSAAPASPPQSNDAIAVVSALAPGTCCRPRAGEAPARLSGQWLGFGTGVRLATTRGAAHCAGAGPARGGRGGERGAGRSRAGHPRAFRLASRPWAQQRETEHGGGTRTALQALVLVSPGTAPPGHQRCEIAQGSGGTEGFDWRFGKKAESKCRHLSHPWVSLMCPPIHVF